MTDLLGRVLGQPKTRGLDLDSPHTTLLRREIILEKPFLRSIYLDWYHAIQDQIPSGDGGVLEIGAGGGFFKDENPDLISSEIFPVEGVDLVADAQHLPIRSGSLKAIVMTNVLHHIPDAAQFMSEAQRTLRHGGRIVMVEPWNTPWSRFLHKRFHNEPMLPEAESWAFPPTGPLSGANAALAWIIVDRDRTQLESLWSLRVLRAKPFMPFRYLASGGVSLRSLQPRWLYPFWKWVDERRYLRRRFAVFAFIVIERS